MKTIANHSFARVFTVALFCIFLFVKAQAQLVDVANNTSDPSNLSDTEPSIAVNPLNPLEIAIVSFSEGWSSTQGGPVWKSTDGGTTWTKVRVLTQPSPASGGPGDQKIQFDQNGNLVVAELGGGISQPRCFILRQTGTDTDPMTVGAFYGDDQPMLEVDKSAGSPFLGRTYSAWLDFSLSPERSTVARSTDEGATVTNVTAGNASDENRTTRSTVGRDGSAYIVFKTREGSIDANFESAHFMVKRSDDGGVTWTGLGANGVSVHGAGQVQTWFTSNWGNSSKGKVGRARSSDAWIAADLTGGAIYVVFCDQDGSGFGQVFVTRSTDRGATWSSPVRVTDGTHHSAYPEIAVSCTGAVGVMYIDFDDSGTNTIFRHRFARSFNNGLNWTDEILQSMDPSTINNAASGFLWGDYEGLTAQGGLFYGVFTGQSIGRTPAEFDPIFFRRQGWQTNIAIACPANVTVNTDPGVCTAKVNYPAPTITGDQCAIQSSGQTGGLPSGANFPTGVTLNKFTVTDAAGTSTSCQFTVTVVDNQPPKISCPANLTVSCEASVKPEDVGKATASDNCSFTLSHADVIVPGSCTHEYTINRTWTAKDAQNNTATCLHVIKVQDKTPPVITCPAAITVTCDTTAAKTGMATATDNCDNNVTITRKDTHISGFCEWFCITDRQWTAEDDCHNTSKCIQRITKDVTPLIEQALASGPITLGQKAATVTIPPGKGNCVVKWLPASGTTAKALPFDDAVASASCTLMSNPIDGSGHLVNPLLGETMKLSILVRLKPSLGTTKLSAFPCILPMIVKQALAPNPDVNELLRVTNLTLGNVNVGLNTPAHIKQLLDYFKCINAGLDICKL